MSTGVVFQQMLVILVMILMGCWIYKKGMITLDASVQISSLITNVCNPAVMIASVFSDEMTATRKDILLMALITAVTYAVAVLAGMLIPRLLRVPADERKYYHMMMVYGNTGFIGIPVTTALLGEGALIYVTVVGFFYNMLFYTHGIAVMQRGKGNRDGNGAAAPFSWKKMINAGTVCSVIAVIIFWFEIPVPVFLSDSAMYMGRCTTFLSMVVLGVSVARMDLKKIFSNSRLYILAVIRMVVFPVGVTVILKPFVSNPTILAVTLLMLSMPVGNMPLMLAQEQGEEAEPLSTGIILTTLLSLITITITTRFL